MSSSGSCSGFAWSVQNQGYCHLVVATMVVVMFGEMYRYDDASGLLWRNVRFVEDMSGFEILLTSARTRNIAKGIRY